MAGTHGPWWAPQSDSPTYITEQELAASWAEAQASARMLSNALIFCGMVVLMALLVAWGYVRQDDVDAAQERQHLEQLQRDGRLPASLP